MRFLRFRIAHPLHAIMTAIILRIATKDHDLRWLNFHPLSVISPFFPLTRLCQDCGSACSLSKAASLPNSHFGTPLNSSTPQKLPNPPFPYMSTC